MAELNRLTGIPEKIGKEWISIAYMQAICAQVGLNIKNWRFDNGIDLEIGSSRPLGEKKISNFSICIQLKSTENWKAEENGHIKYDIPIKTYNQLIGDSVLPQYLVLFTLPPDLNSWVKYQWERENHKHVIEVRHMAYYLSLKGKSAISNTSKIRVEVPLANKLTAEMLAKLYKDHLETAEDWLFNQKGGN